MFNPKSFSQNELPFDSLSEVGLAFHGRTSLDPDDKQALLSGRRTNLIELRNLEYAGMRITSLNAKLSLTRTENGLTALLIHPVYLRSIAPAHLTKAEMEILASRRQVILQKDVLDTGGLSKKVLIELDRETNQFLETDVNALIAPEQVNGRYLTAVQKTAYLRGEIIEISDGTRLQFTATDSQGMRANKIGLIAMVKIKGEEIYNSLYNLKTLTDYSHDYQEAPPTDGYLTALAKFQTMEMQHHAGPGIQAEEANSSHYRKAR